jgi:acetyl-CoA synthetase
MVPEAAIAMLACTRIGAPHSVVFAGFSSNALRDRIQDGHCKVVITANEGVRSGKKIPLKATTDAALEECPDVTACIVLNRTDKEVKMHEGRDIWWHEAVAAERPYCPCEWMDSEDMLFMLFTSGSTGRPKGIQHATAGYLLYAAATHKYVFDLKPDDVYACVADIGWITGHSYIVYGPLCNGATTFMFESTPLFPDASRYWAMVERHKINIFYTAPTAIRALMKFGTEPVKKHDRSSLRVLGSVGEPINPEAWKWYHEVVGEGKCCIVDTYWQTETGGIIVTPLPGCTPQKPGAAMKPFFGIDLVVLDNDGNEQKGNDVQGVLAIRQPWPGMVRTIYGDHSRFMNVYLTTFPNHYFTGDGVQRDKDGAYWITGRVDDVVNVSGHRIGSAEIESALVAHEACAEAAVVGIPHCVKGQSLFAYVIPKLGFESSPELINSLKAAVRAEVGPFAKPDDVLITPALPKTRSGKIMRRLLRKIATQDTSNLGDTSTLADSSVVEALIKAVNEMKA